MHWKSVISYDLYIYFNEDEEESIKRILEKVEAEKIWDIYIAKDWYNRQIGVTTTVPAQLEMFGKKWDEAAEEFKIHNDSIGEKG